MTDEIAAHSTDIPGLLVITLVLNGDTRGWFKENWQREKMTALGLPDFGPVQHSIAYNEKAGVTRGFHAEPWDKLVSVAHGRAFGAWVDLRVGDGFGRVVTVEYGPEKAVFVPRGVANSFQALEDGTVYSYLVNAHWSPEARESYSYVNLMDPSLGVRWPIPLESAVMSDADREHPMLADTDPVLPLRTVIVGRSGQLGRALHALLPDAEVVGRDEVDLADPDSVTRFPWSGVGTIINAAAFTASDAAESVDGRRSAWAVNVAGVAALSMVAIEQRATLVHVSSDYVFDGATEWHHEDEPVSPLSVYGQTKAAGDVLVGQVPRHYVIRTSWVVGDGPNFVRTMAGFAQRGVCPSVVDDQVGRLTFTVDLAGAIVHLLTTNAPFGIYNVTNDGAVQSWCDIARDVFELCGRSREDVNAISTQEYAAGRLFAPRPCHSGLTLDKLIRTGFRPVSASERLRAYVTALNGQKELHV